MLQILVISLAAGIAASAVLLSNASDDWAFQARAQLLGLLPKKPRGHAAEILGPLWGNIAPATVERANSRRSYDIIPVKVENLAEQQRIADTYYAAKLIPKPLKVSAITVWTPKP